jgi:glucoamylase
MERKVRAWIDFESRLQETPNRSGGLGEPRFHADGRADETEWGRPQNDGPALRALAAIRFAWRELALGRSAYVRDRLYRAEIPAQTLIKKDLEYTAHHWRESSFDLWEEVKGGHFFTRMVQRRALEEGALLADALQDGGAAAFYREQARALERELARHYDRKRRIFLPTLDFAGGWSHKNTDLDVAVLLGALHGGWEGRLDLTPAHPGIRASAEALEQAFLALYPINAEHRAGQARGAVAPAIGRYPEDVYDGNGFSVGHPWFLATHAFAEWKCSVGEREAGLRYLARSIRHQGEGGEMAEQFQRTDGFQRGARDLTWSYASFLTAVRACEK